jgi:RNA polymerase primary sigma factor
METTLFNDIKKHKNSQDLVLGNMRLVVHLAKKYQGLGIDLEDLIQEGIIGLCKAKEKFVEGKGKFSSYAALWIKATIMQALNEKSRLVRIPSHKASKADEQIKVNEFDLRVHGGTESAIVEERETEVEKNHMVTKFLEKLNSKQKQIIKMKFGIECEEMKTSEIAKKIGLTVQSVNSIIKNSINIMKNFK